MPSTYTSSLRLTLPATGELSGTWGSTVNDGVTSLTDSAIAGTATVSMTDANYTLTTANGATDEARRMFVRLTGGLTASRNVICPAVSKLYFVYNNTSGGQDIVFKTSAGSGITVPNGARMVLYCNGTDVVEPISNFYGGLTLTSNPTFSAGTANGVLYLNGSKVATSGSALTFNGTEIGTTSTGLNINNANALVRYQNGSGTRTGYLQVRADAFDIWSDQAAVPMVFGVANAEAMRLTSTGLGIGTSSPTHKLQTNGSGRFGTMTTGPGLLSGSSDTFQVGLNQDNTNTTNTQVWAEYVNGATSASWAVRYRPANDTGTAFTRLFLDAASGNLGIGTSSPQGLLDVAASGVTVNQFLTGGAGNNAVTGIFKIGSGVGRGASIQGFRGGSSNVHSLDFYTYNSADVFGMRLDSSGNLGLGVTPSGWGTNYKALDIGSLGGISYNNNNGSTELSNNTYANASSVYTYKTTGAASLMQASGGAYRWYTAPSGTAGNAISFTQAMTLDASGNLGVGTSSPSKTLHISTSSYTYPARIQSTGGATTGIELINTGSSANPPTIGSKSDALFFETNNTERARIDSSGNFGLGVTPSAWSGAYKALQLPNGGAIANDGTQSIYIGQNWYGNAGNKYITTAAASLYLQGTGAHQWYTAPSGTAGNAITFTQAMTLDANTVLMVGHTTNVDNNFKIQTNAAASGVSGIGVNNAGGYGVYLTYDKTGRYGGDAAAIRTIPNVPLAFETNNTERARITSGGDLLVGTTSSAFNADVGIKITPAGDGATYPRFGIVSAATTDGASVNYSLYSTGAAAYRFYVGLGGTVYATNTTISAISDQRFKENIRDLDVGLNAIMALKPRKFDWKAGKGKDKKDDRGFIAQEFEQVFPDLIDEWKDPAPEGEEPYKSVRQDLIPVLVKAIQEQQALITALTARIEALEAK